MVFRYQQNLQSMQAKIRSLKTKIVVLYIQKSKPHCSSRIPVQLHGVSSNWICKPNEWHSKLFNLFRTYWSAHKNFVNLNDYRCSQTYQRRGQNLMEPLESESKREPCFQGSRFFWFEIRKKTKQNKTKQNKKRNKLRYQKGRCAFQHPRPTKTAIPLVSIKRADREGPRPRKHISVPVTLSPWSQWVSNGESIRKVHFTSVAVTMSQWISKGENILYSHPLKFTSVRVSVQPTLPSAPGPL